MIINSWTVIFHFLLMLLLFSPAMAQQGKAGPNENEPNNSRDEATLIDSYRIEGEVGRRGDTIDWFKVEGMGDKCVTITLLPEADDCPVGMKVYSGAFCLGTEPIVTSRIHDTCYIEVYADSDHSKYNIEIVLNDPEDCISYGPDEDEPNDIHALANWINNLTFEGWVENDEVDWFKLMGEHGQYATFALDYYASHKSVNANFCVYSDQEIIGKETSYPYDGDETVTCYIPDECYIKIYAPPFSMGKPYTDVHYTLSINLRDYEDCQGSDEVEPNCTRDQANRIGSLIVQGYCCTGDSDWFLLNGQQGEDFAIALWDYGSGTDINLEVLSEDESVLRVAGGFNSDFTDVHVSGNCWIRVYSLAGEGEYEFEIVPII